MRHAACRSSGNIFFQSLASDKSKRLGVCCGADSLRINKGYRNVGWPRYSSCSSRYCAGVSASRGVSAAPSSMALWTWFCWSGICPAITFVVGNQSRWAILRRLCIVCVMSIRCAWLHNHVRGNTKICCHGNFKSSPRIHRNISKKRLEIPNRSCVFCRKKMNIDYGVARITHPELPRCINSSWAILFHSSQ